MIQEKKMNFSRLTKILNTTFSQRIDRGPYQMGTGGQDVGCEGHFVLFVFGKESPLNLPLYGMKHFHRSPLPPRRGHQQIQVWIIAETCCEDLCFCWLQAISTGCMFVYAQHRLHPFFKCFAVPAYFATLGTGTSVTCFLKVGALHVFPFLHLVEFSRRVTVKATVVGSLMHFFLVSALITCLCFIGLFYHS